jgi:XTP/dITP diphosphohydrolase
MRRLLIATTNRAKLAEYRLILRDIGLELELVSLADLRISEAPEETGATFTENALIKARFYFNRAVIPTLVAEVIRRMKGVEAARRTARLRATIAVIHRDGAAIREQTAEAAIEGVIAERAYPEIRAGFPYRAVLVIPGRNCYLGELGDEEEAQISQRRIALLKLRDELERIAAGRVAG